MEKLQDKTVKHIINEFFVSYKSWNTCRKLPIRCANKGFMLDRCNSAEKIFAFIFLSIECDFKCLSLYLASLILKEVLKILLVSLVPFFIYFQAVYSTKNLLSWALEQ